MHDSRVFDLIMTGHDQDLLINYDGRTAMMESYEQADFVTIADIAFDISEKDGKRIVTWHPSFRVIDTKDVTPDPETKAKTDELSSMLTKELDVAIGTTTTPLDSRRATVRTGEAALGNLVADALREAVKAEVAITNGGGLRGNKEYPAGHAITRKDVLTELPFGNLTMKLRGDGHRHPCSDRERTERDREWRRPLSAGFRPEGRIRCEKTQGLARHLGRSQRQAARCERHIHDRHE